MLSGQAFREDPPATLRRFRRFKCRVPIVAVVMRGYTEPNRLLLRTNFWHLSESNPLTILQS